jgi:hypothetical protein
MRRRMALVDSLAELDDLLAELDPTMVLPPGGNRIRRGHTNGPIKVVLPEHYLEALDDLAPPDEGGIGELSGG